MTRNEFMIELGEIIRPKAPLAASIELGKMLQYLTDFSDSAFTQEALIGVAGKIKKRSPNLMEVRAALASWQKSQATRPAISRPRSGMTAADVWEARQIQLRDEWDDRDGIRRRLQDCQGSMLLLRVLASAVGKWAPQHLGEIPPVVLDMIERFPTQPRSSGALPD